MNFASFSNILLEIFVPNLVSITRPSLSDIGKNSDGGTSNFRISGQSLIKENCHNSRTSDDIDLKLGPVTKRDKRNKITSKKIDFDVMLKNCDANVIFRIFGKFGAIRRPDSGHRVRKSYVFSNRDVFFAKTENKTKKSLTQLCSHTTALSKGTLLDKKHQFLQKMLILVKLREPRH